MRALTHVNSVYSISTFSNCNNEILAREGIDTLTVTIGDSNVPAWGNNEILAREGIDTERLLVKPSSLRCNNEILAREGIDTYLM